MSMFNKPMPHSEIVTNLQKVFNERVTPYAHAPIELTVAEAEQLLNSSKVNVLLFSFTKFGLHLKRMKAKGEPLDRDRTWRSLVVAIEKVKKDDVRIKKAFKAKREQNVRQESAPVTNEPPQDRVNNVREAFQNTLTDGTWCITSEEAAEMLRQNDIGTLRQVFSEIIQTFAEEHAQDALDLINFRLSMKSLQTL